MNSFVENVGWFSVILGGLGLVSLLLTRDGRDRRFVSPFAFAVIGTAAFAGARYGNSSDTRWLEVGGLAIGYLMTGLFLALVVRRLRSRARH